MSEQMSVHQKAAFIKGVKFRDWDISYSHANDRLHIVGYFPDRTAEKAHPSAPDGFYGTKDSYLAGGVEYYDNPSMLLRPEREVIKRKKGDIPLTISRSLATAWSPEELLAVIRDAIHNMLFHEADENIMVHGERVFDPHAPVAAVPA